MHDIIFCYGTWSAWATTFQCVCIRTYAREFYLISIFRVCMLLHEWSYWVWWKLDGHQLSIHCELQLMQVWALCTKHTNQLVVQAFTMLYWLTYCLLAMWQLAERKADGADKNSFDLDLGINVNSPEAPGTPMSWMSFCLLHVHVSHVTYVCM